MNEVENEAVAKHRDILMAFLAERKVNGTMIMEFSKILNLIRDFDLKHISVQMVDNSLVLRHSIEFLRISFLLKILFVHC